MATQESPPFRNMQQSCLAYHRWCCTAGVSIVSPQWVLRSLKGGEAQRCLQISLDTVAHLPASASEQASSTRDSTSEQVVHSLPAAAPQTHGKLLASSRLHRLPLGAAQTEDGVWQLRISRYGFRSDTWLAAHSQVGVTSYSTSQRAAWTSRWSLSKRMPRCGIL